jgi:hypothetical protein
MNKNSKKQMPAPRNYVVVVARARNSAGHMRDRRDRRAKDSRKSWKNEQW